MIVVMLLAVLPRAYAQCPSSGPFTSVSENLTSTPCFQSTVPQGRQFVILTLLERYETWQNGSGCQTGLLGTCAPTSLTISVNPGSFSYTLAGSAGTNPPPGTGWSMLTPGPSTCVDPLCAGFLAKETQEINACAPGDQTCIDAAVAEYNANTANLAHDSQLVYQRTSYRIIALPAGLTAGGSQPIIITTSATGAQPDPNNSGLNQLMSITAGLYADTHFTMNQTPGTMRPLDSRDPAANCANAPGNCNPTYTVQFTCDASSNIARNRPDSSPILLASLDDWPLSLALARQTRRRPADPFRPQGEAAPPPQCPAPPVSYQFLLAPQTQWLVGTSTNFGTETSAVPDYVFTAAQNTTLSPPQNNGLSINTPGFVTVPQTIVVTSQDFGGAGQLRATATFQQGGLTFDADIVDQNGDNVHAPSGACGTTFAQHQFASIPVDQDCNGIADMWEAPFIGQASTNSQGCNGLPITAFTGKEDLEQGFACSSPQGDGYSVHDEYRGFHSVLDDGKTIQWMSTDPVNKFDVFFWDQPNKFTTPLRNILAMQGAAKFLYWRVNATQANAVSAKFNPKKGTPVVNTFNKNSITLASQSGLAVVYASVSLSQNGVHQELGSAQTLVDDGRAILIDLSAIQATTAKPGFPIPNATLLAEVVAHETGHRFSREHPLRPNCKPCSFVALPTNQLMNLTDSQFNIQGNKSTTVYVQLNQYAVPTLPKPQVGDHLSVGRLATVDLAVKVQNTAPSPVYKVTLSGPIFQTAAPSVEVQLLELMDWTANLTLTTLPQWHFDFANDLSKLCPRPVCVCATGPCQL